MPPNPYVLSVQEQDPWEGHWAAAGTTARVSAAPSDFTIIEGPAAKSKTGEKKCSHTALCLVQIGLSIVLPWLNEFLDVEI